jgi:hypothetical protein
MSERITANGDTLMRQAPMTADLYLGEAIEDIDKRLGKGYAKAHPELVAAYMFTAAADYGATLLAQKLQDGITELSSELSDAIQSYGGCPRPAGR